MTRAREKSHVDSLPEELLERVRRTILSLNPEKRSEAILASVAALWKEGIEPTGRTVSERCSLTRITTQRELTGLVEAGRLHREGGRGHAVYLTPELYEAAMGKGAED